MALCKSVKLSSLTNTQNKHVSNVVEAADSLLRAIKEVASSARTLRMLSSEERSSCVSTSEPVHEAQNVQQSLSSRVVLLETELKVDLQASFLDLASSSIQAACGTVDEFFTLSRSRDVFK